MNSDHQQLIVTLWFVTSAHPEKVIATAPKADRGFGRKLLALLHPKAPVSPIGQFALNRSVPPSLGEYYIAAFPGISVIQTALAPVTALTELPQQLLTALPAANIYCFATNKATGFGAFAHWRGTTLKRHFAATPTRVYEDTGLVEPFEASYWAGEHAHGQGGIALPFAPIELAHEAERSWLGFDPYAGADINIVAYAIDGRPEPRFSNATRSRDIGQFAHEASARLGLGPQRREYDDYESYSEDDFDEDSSELGSFARESFSHARVIGKQAMQKANKLRAQLVYRLKHTDRPKLSPPQSDTSDSTHPKPEDLTE